MARTARSAVGGLALAGVAATSFALAAPAHADTTPLQYECTYTVLNVGAVDGDPNVSVDLDVTIPATAQVGDSLTSDVTATVTIPDSRRDSLYGLLGVREIEAVDAEAAAAIPSNTEDARNEAYFTVTGGSEPMSGTIPLSSPRVPVPTSGELVVDVSGAVDPLTLTEEGTYTVEAGDFQAYIRGYAENGDAKTSITLDCTNVSADANLGTIEVTAASEPEQPPTDDGTDDGTTPPPATDDDTPATDDGAGTGDDGAAADGGSPQRPEVVQTDDQALGTSPVLLGGLALAGAGAAALMTARRRMATQR